MTDKEKILSFEKYMRDIGYDEERISFNIMTVKLLVNKVLCYFDQTLDNIDTYSFEEFTDMVQLIDEYFGGRKGIPKMLDAMKDMTEFLKQNKFIKGGKIAYYKRMFSDVDYYFDKYDMMTGKKDDTKDFIKNVTTNRFSSMIIKLVDDINVYEFKTIDKIDKILNDVPFEKDDIDDNIPFLVTVLNNLKLLELRNGQIETTKKGRSISRLTAEERYGALLYLLLYEANWKEIAGCYEDVDQSIDFKDILYIFSTVFKEKKEVVIDIKNELNINEKDMLIEICSDRFRIARAESMPCGSKFIDICFEGMGLIEISHEKDGKIIYKTNDFGQDFFKFVYRSSTTFIKNEIESINHLIKKREYEDVEKSVIKFLATFGGNSIVWDYLGQILLLKKDYRTAYCVLKFAYENCVKRGKAAKSILYHLILCCRKLKLNEDIQAYEEKLQSLERA